MPPLHKRYQTKPWEELTFADTFLFCKILESELNLCRSLLELLLHIKIDHRKPPHGERTMQESLDAKSVRWLWLQCKRLPALSCNRGADVAPAF